MINNLLLIINNKKKYLFKRFLAIEYIIKYIYLNI